MLDIASQCGTIAIASQCEATRNMETKTETQPERIATSIRLETDIYSAIARLADEEDRPSQANMIERLLKTHPRVKKILEPETATV